MLSKKSIVEFDDEKIIDTREIINEIRNNHYSVFKFWKIRKVALMIKGKEVFVKLINLPKVKDDELTKLIENELKYYLNFTDEMLHSYCIYKEYSNSLDLLVYCINWNNLNVIDSLIQNGFTVKMINPIQVVYINYFNKRIGNDKYILIFQNENKIYFIASLNKKLICNYICDENITKINFKNKLEELKNKAESFEKNEMFQEIYFLNFDKKELINEITNSYLCNDLGYESKEKIMKSIS